MQLLKELHQWHCHCVLTVAFATQCIRGDYRMMKSIGCWQHDWDNVKLQKYVNSWLLFQYGLRPLKRHCSNIALKAAA